MSIEGGGPSSGGSIGGGISAGPSIGAAAIESGGFSVPGIGVGSPLSLESFGAKMTAPSVLPVNDGPAGGSYLETTIPYEVNNFSLLRGENRFNQLIDLRLPQPVGEPVGISGNETLNTAAVLRAVELILSQASSKPAGTKVPEFFQSQFSDIKLEPSPKIDVVEPVVIPLPEIRPMIEPEVIKPGSIIQPAIIPNVDISQKAEIRTGNALISQAVTQPVFETKKQEALEELVKEEVLVKDILDERLEDEDKEESSETRLQRVVDHSAASTRIAEIIEAARKSDTGGEISGAKIVGSLPGQHAKNRSGELNIVDPEGRLLDGTLPATFKELAGEKFASVLDVIKVVPKIVAKHIPVTRGVGQAVTDQAVAKVYDQFKGRIPPALEVIRRVIKMKWQKNIQINQPSQVVPVWENVEKKIEGSIQDNQDLAQALKAP